MNEKLKITNIIDGIINGDYIKYKEYYFEENNLSLYNDHLKIWSGSLRNLTKFMEEEKIHYVLFKMFNIPYAYMYDVDLLIEKQNDIVKIYKFLKDDGYLIYRDKYSLNRCKITAIIKNNPIQIDIYPEPTWFNMKYISQHFITNNKIKQCFNTMYVYTPNPTLDIYIIMTHSYNHGIITMGEIAHIINTVKTQTIDWDLLFKIADKYKLLHSIVAYIYLLHLMKFRHNIVFNYRHYYEHYFKKDFFSRLYLSWFYKKLGSSYPLKFPLVLRILSSVFRLFRKNLNNDVKPYDEFLGYVLAFIYRGGRRELVLGEDL